ncbi:MAG: diaminopimelate decarboxylase [Nitrospirae bacterium]|uniref:Diaminopimelate decarboxylase n=1 Tax=Leptospirillum ferrodiazotrophum TaxID=412449 RepID=C6HWT2_9BACT|nr:MAG: diaminopimelate decarboxylase [Leptospirillum ferrodiazotrophum]MCL5953181.1 diaminopimelate decarboxylase [Nitrospirota bacterium]
MSSFEYRNGRLFVENLPVEEIVEKEGSPLYIYSKKALVERIRAYREAFAAHPTLVAYAMKANGNLAILSLLAKEGAGIDVVSGGELFRARKAGVPADKIVFAGVGKSREEIAYALKEKILMFNVESQDELDHISEVAVALGTQAPVALRVNPDVDPKTHPYISTGMKKSKFGIPVERAVAEYQRASTLPGIKIVGIHQHIGSQLTEIAPFRDAFDRLLAFHGELSRAGIKVTHLDLGGGLGIRYRSEEPPSPADLAALVLPRVKDLGVTLVLEPGRSIVGNAGILVTRVLYRKNTAVKSFVIGDAGMNDLLRPSLYGAHHDLLPVKETKGETIKGDLVGPICETGDFLATDREMPDFAAGDLIAVMSAGAYGFSMASNYNARPRPAEILVDGSSYRVVRDRESFEDLIRGERV